MAFSAVFIEVLSIYYITYSITMKIPSKSRASDLEKEKMAKQL